MEQNAENQPTSSENQPQPSSQSPQSSNISQVPQDSRNMAMLCHLLGLFTSFVGPLILWLIKKDEDKFVDSQGKEALNFQITVIIAGIAAGLLSFICIGIFVAIAVSICDIVFCILACVAASKGQDYRYPLSLRLIK
ncbi:MAG TPA: DUF4870 domain-containing protein [Anaerohalosphaeraceae bacterium]|nr:DUF4870 domain-containing protein [Phycisphaerae bacterium]HOK94542.1 DUF4870 domain-containing protein [Anaerohalosphaeraceae bacterium]HOL32523.1 DUF4870 domain-containing protein [Anaerohalosphaeraceae bacterium]HOM75007.1 DUF4870 domain-containing protein [Anaerohalosphaeraceae bacterium]HPC63258.1 DUF4870 domain-containing protein [Anaerohalosphaeraceae bacterium]